MRKQDKLRENLMKEVKEKEKVIEDLKAEIKAGEEVTKENEILKLKNKN